MNKLSFSREKLSETSNMPQISVSIDSWGVTLTLIKIDSKIVNYRKQETRTIVNFKGTIQPLKPEEIELKPEDQRSWAWQQIHTLSAIKLKVNDKIYYNGTTFKIMAVLDYSINGHMEYHAIKDFAEVSNG